MNGASFRPGTRVRLRPSRRADIMDLALTGRIAEVAAVEEDFEGQVHVAVVLEGDPGRDLGAASQIGHRFFFAPDELEPLPGSEGRAPAHRVLVAGVGNIFMADDGFGPEAATALAGRPLPDGVHVADFGIRGMDLAYRMLDGYDTVVLLDATPHGRPPGTLSVIEPDLATLPAEGAPEAHAMDPVKVIALARQLGDGDLPRLLVVGCEPEVRMKGDEVDVVVGLSEPVREAVERSVPFVESLLADILAAAREEVNLP
ncbi:hydrogenase maturation protease [Streptomyces griseus]|uniref:hydrogenase maturation protease n=1 Tax=Streptomyces griseus TaxID=1911 RepID=UPI0005622003|nr:hydrogenase maturation protease [Streptomyces griseus]